MIETQWSLNYYREVKHLYNRLMDMTGHSTQDMYITTGNINVPLTKEGNMSWRYTEEERKKADIVMACVVVVFSLIDMAVVGGAVYLFLKMLMNLGVI